MRITLLAIALSACDSNGAPNAQAGPVGMSQELPGDQHIVSVRPRTTVLETLTQADARNTRGMIRDRYGSPLFAWSDGKGWEPVEPWLAWLGKRTMNDVLLDADHPEYGTKTKTAATGLQKEFQRLLTGRYGMENPWVELWRRLRLEPRPQGVDVFTTLSLPLMRVAAEAAGAEAIRLAEAARKQGDARQELEHRTCKAWDVDVAITAQDGAILAAVTAVGIIGPDGQVSLKWETGNDRVSCLRPEFEGALRALGAPVMPGSTQKVWTYAEAAEIARHGDPWLQFEERDGDWWLLDRAAPDNDPDNGDGRYILDPGKLERVYGRDVPDCNNHGSQERGGPIRFVDAFARSANAPACFLASAAMLGGDRIGPAMRALQLDGPVDVLLPLGDTDLERARIHLGTFALGGKVATLSGGVVTLPEATKMPLGKEVSPTTLGLTAAVRMVGNGGVYTSPYLLLGARLPDGSERLVTPPTPVRVVSEEAAKMVQTAMRAVVSTSVGTGYTPMKGLSPERLGQLGLKTGTADLTTEVNGKAVSLPSPKSAVALYPLDASPVSIAVWARSAQWLDNDAALRVVRAIIESGALDTTVAAR